MSVLLHSLVDWCNQVLEVDKFRDYAPNGLQIEGASVVHKIVTGVTASRALIEAAIQAQANAILVHHGYFWKGEDLPLVGMKGKRIQLLMQHNISLIAYHLPLDAHPLWGNNAALADLLEFKVTGALDPTEQRPIGHIGSCTPMSIGDFTAHLSKCFGRVPPHLAGGGDIIRRVGWCSGGAQDFIGKAAAQGCDAYISGEVSERTVHEAAELGIHYFACGHHKTETGGVQRLGTAIAKEFEIDVEFVDLTHEV